MECSFASLVPELLVTDLVTSLRFWRDLCGFTVVFDRFDEGFAYLDLNGGQVMLEQRGRNRLFNSPAVTVAGRFSKLVIAALNSSTIASNPAIRCVFDGPLDAVVRATALA